ncbi:MAG: DUF5916 domain-containing protein [Gemmatimonadota bacterium]
MQTIRTAAIALAAFATTAFAQDHADRGRAMPPSRITPPSATVAVAARATTAPLIDGRADDSIWSTAQVIEDFRVYDPSEDGEPRFQTQARVAYDERNLYVIVRSFDAHPDSIRALLARRDQRTASDEIKVLIDSYHDKRSGFQFAVNPAGVKRDIAIFNDSDEDTSWDAVWDAAARVDSAGWVAEFRIPLSQLRYSAAESHTFGLAISREIARYSERHSWPVYRRSKAGIASQFGELTGIRGIASPRRLEVAPYSVAKTANVVDGVGPGYMMRSQGTAGADVKYGLTSNLTIDATVNPDFGQVEADPSVLNLSAFESFFPEKRPFFLEGQGLFRFAINCNDGDCSGLFYSRRIGRSPQLGNNYYANGNVTSSTILGAAKLTGRLRNGMSVGFLNATTDRELAPGDKTIEPLTNYSVGRLQQDFRGGRGGVGLMLTNVHRSLDQWTANFLRSDATSMGIDTRHETSDRRYSINAYAAASNVRGSAIAIASTQRSGVHNYQRRDDDLAYDPTRTSLSGTSFQINLNKNGGGITRFSTGYQYISPGFEINDVGFLSRANSQNQYLWYAIQLRTPTKVYRQWQTNFNQWTNWTADGMRQELGGNINSHMQLKNNIWLHAGQGGNALAPSYCDLCSRGGPAVRQSRSLWGWAGVEGDNRKSIVPYFFTRWATGDEGRSRGYGIDPSVTIKIASRFSTDLGVSFGRDLNDAQWYQNYGDVTTDTADVTFARLDQKTLSMNVRVNFTATPTLSMQIYAQPFMTGGDYTDWRELSNPRGVNYLDRWLPYGSSPLDDGFNFRQFRSNSVVRWEYRPGSTLYFVWAQERTSSNGGATRSPFSVGSDTRSLFGSHPGNVFLIKGSYWLSL